MGKFEKVTNWFKKAYNTLKERTIAGKKWIGLDGLINMETSALLVILLMVFFPFLWAAVFSLVIMAAKCAVDKIHKHENEKHDFICICFGVLIGAILGLAQGLLILF